ncbi:MAG: CorA family divalent cation transporter [Clostridiaceae bacterium]|nr:CorA family divalent cation transporter [Clostridiaceae bacterium]
MEVYRLKDNDLFETKFEDISRGDNAKYWIIAAPEEIHENNDFFKFHNSTVEECLSPGQNPRLEVYDEFSFGVINMMDRDTSSSEGLRLTAKEMDFYITPKYLILVAKPPNKLINDVKKEVLENANASNNYVVNLSKILYILLHRLTSIDNVVLKDIEARIALLEEQVMEDIRKDFTKEIIGLRKQLLFLKRYYEPLLDIAEGLEENENGLIEEGALKYFGVLKNRIERLNNNVLHLRDYVTQVREAYQAQVDISLNHIMKMFTVITAVFLPLTLIAGWYGMNFKYMPELSWVYGYPFVFVLSAAVAAISLIYFKKHHYM